MGLVMRWFAVASIPGVEYSFLRQGHSHVAFLGWGYLAMMIFIIEAFLLANSLQLPKYRWNLIATIIFIAGMLFSFPVWGYKTVSITLLSLFLVASVVLVIQLLRDFFKFRKDIDVGAKAPISSYFLIAAFVWYLLSGIGPFALGPIVVFLGKGDWYHLAVYYYLHFLYNGFFVFGIGALFFKYMEAKKYAFSRKKAIRFFGWSTAACLPAYALSTLWKDVPDWVFGMAILAGGLQLLAIAYLLPIVRSLYLDWSAGVKWLLRVVLASYILKLLFQFSSAIPALATRVYAAKSFVVVGYIHLVTLGFISLFLLAWGLLSRRFTSDHLIARLGVQLFIIGMLVTEILLFIRGLFQWIQYGGFVDFFSMVGCILIYDALGNFIFFVGTGDIEIIVE